MSLRVFLITAAVAHAIGGLEFLFVPAQLMAVLGVTLDPGGVSIAWSLGASHLGFAVILWLLRNERASVALQAVLLGSFIYLVITVLGIVLAILSGVMNAAGWGTVVIDGLLAAGFGYFRFRPGAAPPAP